MPSVLINEHLLILICHVSFITGIHYFLLGGGLTFIELFVKMVFFILLRMHAEGIDAMGRAAHLNYDKCFVPIPLFQSYCARCYCKIQSILL
jgi:hypothetical protein